MFKYLILAFALVTGIGSAAGYSQLKSPLPAVSAAAASQQIPYGWTTEGSVRQYEITIDTEVRRTGDASATLRSLDHTPAGSFSTLMQYVRPDEFRGKRIRLSGYLRSAHVDERGLLWLRIDGADKDPQLAFDNMWDRPATGTTAWRRYDIVLDVPVEAGIIAFGFLLVGQGQLWADDISLEVVGEDVAPTKGPNTAEQRAMVLRDAEDFRRDNADAYNDRMNRYYAAKASAPVWPVNTGFEMR